MYRLPQHLLSWATAALFLGFAWKGLFFDFPLREFFWNEALVSDLLASFGIDWSWWVSAEGVNAYLPNIQLFISSAFVLGFIAVWWQNMPIRSIFVWLAIVFNTIVLLLGLPGHNYSFGYVLEIALRFGTPLLWLAGSRQTISVNTYFLARIFIAATFIGHGLYAMNYYPRPYSFVNWTTAGLGISEPSAINLLFAVGILDLIAAALLLIPKPSWSIPVAMTWLLPWAFLTTLARYWANSAYEDFSYLILRWSPEVLIRVPHVLVVLAVFVAWRSAHRKLNQAT
ncbi:MAG: hypothetical protein AAFY91_05680 [Bacteroidota bacterium]